MKSFLVLSAASIISYVAAQVDLPFDGSFLHLNITTLKEKYLLHIVTMRENKSKTQLDKYFNLTIPPRLRNGVKDGVCGVNVDDLSMFKDQVNFKRTEFVQKFVVKNRLWITASMRFPQGFINETIDWQTAFPESHCWEVRVQQTNVSYPELRILSNNKYEAPVWKTKLHNNKWYNFGILVDKEYTWFYVSTNDHLLRLVKKVSSKCDIAAPEFGEHHFGLLSWQNGTDGKHDNIGSTETVWFSGITADVTIDKSLLKGGGSPAEQNEKSSGSSTASQNEEKGANGTSASGTPAKVNNDSGANIGTGGKQGGRKGGSTANQNERIKGGAGGTPGSVGSPVVKNDASGGGSTGVTQNGAAQGGGAQGGSAQGGNGQGGNAQSGNGQGGNAQGGDSGPTSKTKKCKPVT
uniref:Uncharacterized protein AlNc14C1317G12885 n=1 Tax=Albugo laibachii Nc14 TaxID=890382 RepID=F0X2M9_9STRA|nr:conserved hypothetical protein [Albugo laibachii Nc14]|eukprot:CCA28146.1 conserved hypothetical protein [Albugo laibachii Nc14]